MTGDSGRNRAVPVSNAITAAIEKVRETVKGDDADAINSAVQNLEQATHALSKHMYDAAQAAAGSTPDAGGDGQPESSAAGDDVIDAEFEKKA